MNKEHFLDDKDEFEIEWPVASRALGKSHVVRELFPNAIEVKLSAVTSVADITGFPVVPHKGEAYALR